MTTATADAETTAATYADAFQHPDGRTHQVADGRHLDPMVVHRELVVGTAGKVDELLTAAQTADDAEAAQALHALAAVARTAFGLAPFDAGAGSGATEADCLDELYRYLELAA